MSADSHAQAGRKKRQKVLASGAQVPKHRSSKDTKRWCKGIKGREHAWIYEEWKHSRSMHYDPPVSVRVCKGCRREGETVGRGWWWARAGAALGPAF